MKSKINRLLAIVVIAIFATSFVACNDEKDEDQTSSNISMVTGKENNLKKPFKYKIPSGTKVVDADGVSWSISGTVEYTVVFGIPPIRIEHYDIIITNDKTGETHHFQGVPIRDENGNTSGFTGEITDANGRECPMKDFEKLLLEIDEYLTNTIKQ